MTEWEMPPKREKVHVRQKRLINLFAGIGVIINSVQFKKVKQSINRLQEQNILQDQKIDEFSSLFESNRR